jgi:hypothetical protein
LCNIISSQQLISSIKIILVEKNVCITSYYKFVLNEKKQGADGFLYAIRSFIDWFALGGHISSEEKNLLVLRCVNTAKTGKTHEKQRVRESANQYITDGKSYFRDLLNFTMIYTCITIQVAERKLPEPERGIKGVAKDAEEALENLLILFK